MGEIHDRLLNALVRKSVAECIEPTRWESMPYWADNERLMKVGAWRGERLAGTFIRVD